MPVNTVSDLSNYEVASITLLIANGILVPVVLFYVAHAKNTRLNEFAGVHKRLDHLDECLDGLRLQVVGSGVTRVEFDSRCLDIRREMLAEIDKQDTARHDQSARTMNMVTSLEDRLTRRIELIEGRARPLEAEYHTLHQEKK
jgi:hypothetical protein